MSLEKALITQTLVKPVKEGQFHLRFFLAIVLCLLLGSIALLNLTGAISYYFIKAAQVILFVAFGYIYISPKQNFLKPQPVEKQKNHIIFITFLLCIFLSAYYILLKKDVWLMAFSSSAAFVLPFILKLTWHLFTSIPPKEFNTWFPRDRTVTEKASVSLDSLLVRLKITQHVSDIDEKIYTVFIPQHVKPGDFFSRFLAEHNTHIASSIEDIDTKGNKYAWEFFITGFYGLQLRRLNPDLTMSENKIKTDAVVYIKRLRQPVKLSFYNKNLLNETIK